MTNTTVSITVNDLAFYSIIVDMQAMQISAFAVVDVSGNDVSIAWQLPQYIILSIGEILFSVTGNTNLL